MRAPPPPGNSAAKTVWAIVHPKKGSQSVTMKSRAPTSRSFPKKSPSKESAVAKSCSFPIVAIGASAGGLEAYTEFFRALPADTGMGFVLIQHLDPSHQSMLAEIIAKATQMPVEEVKSGVRIRPNRVYAIPPNTLMAIANCVFTLSPRGKGAGQHLAVNFFMRSLAQEQKSRAIGIILSGTGTDGTSGMEAIKAEGGITFAQEPVTAKYDGMPRSAIDSACVDFILPPRKIAEELHRIQHHPYVRAAEHTPEEQVAVEEQGKELADSVAAPSHEQDFIAILDQLRKASGVDFRQYKPNTIHRRALRRMVILKLDSLGEYAKYLKENPEEGSKLFDDVLIPVTSFFRDFEAFEALKAQVYPAIVKDKANKGTIRMWAPGCSTGEETYSLAMTLLEFLGDKAASFQVQIFGTDLNEKGIQHARAGVYRESIAEEISPERIQRFFVKVDDGYRVNKAVRDMCVFARQNLANDPPFSQMNVVACRNLLIYIQPVLQKKIIPILHYALKPSGFLVLGGSESVSAFPDLFSIVDKKHKIYAKKAIASRLHYDFVQSYYPARVAPNVPGKGLKAHDTAKDELDVHAEADRVVLKHHAPVGVVVNSAMEVVQFRGRTTPYLEPAPGKPSLNVLKLARNGLAIELRTLIGAAAKKNAPVKKDGVSFDGNGHKRILNLSVTPLGEKGSRDKRSFLVLFDDVTPQWIPGPENAARGKARKSTENKDEAKRLKRELTGAREALTSAIESEDSLKEEFQSANEEILSANEELQSTNEELETSKEELQSANEELNTLNAELRHKNSELHELGNDISNLLNSTRIPVVMLDRRLHIRRLTATADKLLKVVPSDIGRPFADIKLNLNASDLPPSGLEPIIAKVLENLQPLEQDVRDMEGHWHSLSVLPYQTQENKIDGVVLALQDIDAIKSANRQLEKAAEFFRDVMDTVREPLLVLDADLKIVAANESFLYTFQVSSEQTIHKFLYALGSGEWNVPRLRSQLEQVLSKGHAITNFEVAHDFESIGSRTMLLNARILSSTHGAEPMILVAIEDITERKLAEEKSLELQERLEHERRVHDTTLSSITDFAYTLDREGRFLYANQPLLDFWRVKLEDLVGRNLFELQTQNEFYERLQQQIQQVFATGERFTGESPYADPSGKVGYYEYTFNPVFGTDGTVELVVGSTHDLTERRLAEAALIKSEKLAASGRLAAALAHEINNPLQAVTNLMTLLGQSPRLDTQDQVYAAMAAEELDRVTHLTRQSLSFYKEVSSPAAVNVEEVIESVMNLYARRVQVKKIEVIQRYLSDATIIHSYPGEIRQVISTLLVNAMQAVPEGGTIAVRVRKSSHWKNPAISGVRIVVADSGQGISANNKPRIFEPFFTTKGEQGIGLGLWVASGIITRLGGTIRMRSSVRPGKSGTSFSIFLPSQNLTDPAHHPHLVSAR